MSHHRAHAILEVQNLRAQPHQAHSVLRPPAKCPFGRRVLVRIVARQPRLVHCHLVGAPQPPDGLEGLGLTHVLAIVVVVRAAQEELVFVRGGQPARQTAHGQHALV